MKKFLPTIRGLMLALSLTLMMSPVLALAQTKAAPKTTEERCKAFQSMFKLSNNTDVIEGKTVFCSASQLILAIITFIQVLAGTVTALFLMIGGFLFITSGGNEEQAEKGKKILTNSVIGLVVIILSYAIVRVVSSLISTGK